MKAQKLLADIYNAILGNPTLWASALLVVLYDEHGGFYDHVEPPAAVPPSPPQPDWEYGFDRLGVRVPALLVSPWVRRGFDSTTFDHTSLLSYLTEKWALGPLGDRTAQANSIGPLISEARPRADTVEKIELTQDRLRPPSPDLEEEAVAYITSHHKALALIARRLRLELLRESPLTYAWLGYLVEVAAHWLFGLGSRWGFRLAHERLKANWRAFHIHRRRQAVAHAAGVLRHPQTPTWRKQFAAETLGLATGQPFHLDPQPVRAAVAWLDGHPPG